MNYIALTQKTKFLLNQNSSVLLTGIGVIGTVGTAYLTGRASFRAAEIIRERQEKLDALGMLEDTDGGVPLVVVPTTTRAKAILVWKEYVPAVGVGALTVGAIIVSHRIDAKRIVALTVASGISERAFKEYKEKVVAKLGEREDTKIRDAIAQDRVTNNPPPRTSELVLAGDGKVLCMDMLTGRYFMSTAEDLKRAENRINYQLNQQMYSSLSEFYEEIGLDATSYSDTVGWNSNKLVEIKLSSAMSTDNRPCLALEFDPHPFPEYSRLRD